MNIKENFCRLCKSKNTIVINVLKHKCFFCNNCRNLFFTPKNRKTIFNYISFILKFINRILRINYLDKILCFKQESPEEAYYYYKSIIENQKYQNTKWWEYDEKFIEYLKENNIDLNNKRIISISEEPGFIYDKLKKFSNNILFTALNNEVSKIMRDKIGVNTITYNANTDDLTKLINEKYDIVLMRWVLGHVNNLDQFINTLNKITSNNAVIFCNFQKPSFQLSVVFGYDNYTFSAFYDEKYVESIFNSNGFEIIKKDTQIENILKKYYNSILKKILFLPIYSYYYLQHYLKNKIFGKNYEIPIKETKVTFILKKTIIE